MFHAHLLTTTSHRPWPLPAQPWVMQQSWHDLLFAHWPIAPEVMRPFIPPQLELDTYDGQAWLSVVPFRMSGVVPRGVPSVPWLSAFPELNLRTYVKLPAPPHALPAASKPGVWFFSLEAANPIAVAIARRVFKLPYFRATMQLTDRGDRIDYTSTRTHTAAPPAQFVGSYGPTDGIYAARRNTLEHWLTERYCLYTVDRGKLLRGEIHHLPWPLQPAQAQIATNTIAQAAGFSLPPQPPLLQFARRLDVLIWPLTAVPLGNAPQSPLSPLKPTGAVG
jgi:uncharacterized protein YqjF (DUF2071 family)